MRVRSMPQTEADVLTQPLNFHAITGSSGSRVSLYWEMWRETTFSRFLLPALIEGINYSQSTKAARSSLSANALLKRLLQ